MRTGERLVEIEDGPGYLAAEPEVVIGELDGPVGYAIANLLGDQIKGHSRVFADPELRLPGPPDDDHGLQGDRRQRQVHQHPDGVPSRRGSPTASSTRSGRRHPEKKADDLGIIVSVWLDPAVLKEKKVDHEKLFETQRAAVAKAARQGDAGRAEDRLAPREPGQDHPLLP